MRVLVLSTSPRQPDNHLLWEGLRELAEVDTHYFTKHEQKNLGAVLKRFDFSVYDRVVCDLLFRYLVRQRQILSRISGLLIYEEDACQEFIENSKWKGAFSKFYRQLPNARVVLTGFQVCRRFQAMGVDAHFLPKGFDSAKLYDMGLERDIPLGFVGRLNSDTYQQRREFLQRAEREFGLQILRAEPGDEYRTLLNRINVFVTADIGLGEYMAKNFEAIACGCLVMAYRQGLGEEEALGFVNGENIVLYGGYEEFCQRLAFLMANPAEMARLRVRAGKLAHERFDYLGQAESLYGLLRIDARVPQSRSWLTRLLERLWAPKF